VSTSTDAARSAARRAAGYAAATLLLILGTATGATAQSGRAGAGASSPAAELDIAVTVSDHEGPPLILRRTSDAPRNVVLVNPSTADAQQLSDAIRALLLLEAADPAGTRRSDRAAASPRFTASVPRFPWAEAMLVRLRASARAPRAENGGPWSESVRLPIPRLKEP
jgi:hypothetical protein